MHDPYSSIIFPKWHPVSSSAKILCLLCLATSALHLQTGKWILRDFLSLPWLLTSQGNKFDIMLCYKPRLDLNYNVFVLVQVSVTFRSQKRKGHILINMRSHLYLHLAVMQIQKSREDRQISTANGSHMRMTQLGHSETLYFVFGLNECASCLGLLALDAGMDTSLACQVLTVGPHTPACKVQRWEVKSEKQVIMRVKNPEESWKSFVNGARNLNHCTHVGQTQLLSSFLHSYHHVQQFKKKLLCEFWYLEQWDTHRHTPSRLYKVLLIQCWKHGIDMLIAAWLCPTKGQSTHRKHLLPAKANSLH